ncbi:MAG: hypothetical protein QOH26_1640 [Actinomycetota bacterium]|jgi:hypothetical protein|nr:hypothetical protein [Actinomycetota bacterium]
MTSTGNGGEPNESEKERLDRELIELLNELRVALPGVQVLFAFLLTVPFSQGFTKLSPGQIKIFFASFLFAAASSAFLIAPSAYHRIMFRGHDKKQMLKTSNKLAIVGTLLLATAMTLVVYLITDFLFGTLIVSLCTAGSAGLFAGLWFALPLVRRLRSTDPHVND